MPFIAQIKSIDKEVLARKKQLEKQRKRINDELTILNNQISLGMLVRVVIQDIDLEKELAVEDSNFFCKGKDFTGKTYYITKSMIRQLKRL